MIELYEGVPGSAKSYHAICEKFLPWVKQGRRLYIAVDGIYLDRLSLFTGIELSVLEQQITLWKDSVEVLQAFPHVEPGSAVIIDEAQTVFRSMQKGRTRIAPLARNASALRRGYSAHESGFSADVPRGHALIEATVKFRKLALWACRKSIRARCAGIQKTTRSSGPSSAPTRRRSTPTIRVTPRRRSEKRSAVIPSSNRHESPSALPQACLPLASWPGGPGRHLSSTRSQFPGATSAAGVAVDASPSQLGAGSLLNPLGLAPVSQLPMPLLRNDRCAFSAVRA
jgi:zona occludens toxin